MTIYKFQDTCDGRYCFVVANTEQEATAAVLSTTSIPVKLVDSKPVQQLKRPIIIHNDILPF